MTNNNDNILNNIDRGQTWIDVETVAKLKGITKRGVVTLVPLFIEK